MAMQKCVLKVNIHCDGCENEVKKILQKTDGVFSIEVDAEKGKVTVAGDVDTAVLIKKLAKYGKRAEVWGAWTFESDNQNPNHLVDLYQGMQIDSDEDGDDRRVKGGNSHHRGGQHGQQQNPRQQLQQIEGLQDQKVVKIDFQEDEDLSDDEYGDEFDEDLDDEDDDLDDELDDPKLPLNKVKPGMPMPIGRAADMVMGGMKNLHPQFMKVLKGGNVGSKKGGGPIAVTAQVNGKGGKEGGGGGKQNSNGVRQTGGGFEHEAKDSNYGGFMSNKNIHGNCMGGYPAMAAADMGHIGSLTMPPVAQGLPASSLIAGDSSVRHYPQHQYYLPALMNRERATGDDGFRSMIYARPPSSVSSMPPYPYPPPPPPADPCTHSFSDSDENTSSCRVM